MRHRLTSCLLFMLQSQWSRLFDTFRHTQFNFIAPWPHFLCPLPPPAHSSPVTHSPVHEWTLHVCVHQKCRWSQATSGQVCARTGLAWPGLGWAVHHRLRLSFVPRASYLALASIFPTLLCCECSFLLVRSSEAFQFPLKCFGVFCRAFSGFVLHACSF